MFSAPHTATLRQRKEAVEIGISDVIGSFTVGYELIGMTSEANAVILYVHPGKLAVRVIEGTYEIGEDVFDAPTSHATISALPPPPALDKYGEPIYYIENTDIKCRFFALSSADIKSGGTFYERDSLYALIPPDVTPAKDDTIEDTTDRGYAHVYRVADVKPAYSIGTLHHYTVKLARLA